MGIWGRSYQWGPDSRDNAPGQRVTSAPEADKFCVRYHFSTSNRQYRSKTALTTEPLYRYKWRVRLGNAKRHCTNIAVFDCTFSLYNCINRHQLHNKIFPCVHCIHVRKPLCLGETNENSEFIRIRNFYPWTAVSTITLHHGRW